MLHYNNLDSADIKYFCEIDKVEKIEQWNHVNKYEFIYAVSDLGRVKSLKFGKQKILKQCDNFIYMSVCLSVNNIKHHIPVHIVVACSFLGHVPCGKTLVINHKDLNKHNNIKTNLEITTTRINSNRAHLPSTSKYIGVCWEKESNKWVARIHVNKKRKTLGRFKTEIEAHNAYQKALCEVISI